MRGEDKDVASAAPGLTQAPVHVFVVICSAYRPNLIKEEESAEEGKKRKGNSKRKIKENEEEHLKRNEDADVELQF